MSGHSPPSPPPAPESLPWADEKDDSALLDISESLVAAPAVPISTVESLSFSSLLSPPLLLQTNEAQCGGKLWPAGMVLAEFLLRGQLEEMKGKTIIELGAGSGLVGLAVALGLQQQQKQQTPPQPQPQKQQPQTQISLTDGASALIPLLTHNIHLNHLPSSSSPSSSLTVSARHLPWGTDTGGNGAAHGAAPAGLPTSVHAPPPTVILAADCVYFEPAFPLLEATIDALLPPGPDSVCWFCYLARRKADKGMVKRFRKRGWAVREVDWRGAGVIAAAAVEKEKGRGKGEVGLWEVRKG